VNRGREGEKKEATGRQTDYFKRVGLILAGERNRGTMGGGTRNKWEKKEWRGKKKK